MKKLLLLLVLVGTLTSCGSIKLITTTSELESKTEQIKLSTTKNKNFINANEWMVERFVSAKSVIQFSDKEAGIVKGKYNLNDEIYAIITVRVKDSAAKIEIIPSQKVATLVKYKVSGMYVAPGPPVGYTAEQYEVSVGDLLESFKLRMNIITNEF